jgi:hypothetical protein
MTIPTVYDAYEALSLMFSVRDYDRYDGRTAFGVVYSVAGAQVGTRGD